MSATERSDDPQISFVVIAHNEAPIIGRALDRMLAQPVSKEVLVVDDGSTDGTQAVVQAIAGREPSLRMIALDRNRGRGFARHAGIGQARGRFIATVDADILLPVDWWERCRPALGQADAVAGTAVPDGDVAYLHRRLRLRPNRRPHTTAVTGSNAIFRRETLQQVGFDPCLRDGEDIALGHAMREARIRAATVPGVFVEHHEQKSLRQTILWLHQSGRGATRQLWRYRQVRRPDLATAGWLLSNASGAILLARRDRTAAIATPMLYLSAAAAAHVAGAFVCTRRDALRLLAATAIDTMLLTAYFTGRIAGVPAALARHPAGP